MGIDARTLEVVGLPADFPVVGIADDFVLVLWYVHILRLVVGETEVEGEEALTVAVGKFLVDDDGV